MSLEFRNVTKRYGNVEAVREFSLTVQDQEFMVLLGPSGCGKTTLLRLVAGFLKPEEGSIYLDGVDITHLRPDERNVSMVFQDYALYPHMTAFRNIEFPLKVQGVSRSERAKRVREVAEFLEIAELLERRPRELSGGQRQRVALARAIIRQPRLFLMDEPLASLDAKIRTRMRSELKALQRELGVTTIYVTHDQEEAMTMGDSVAVIKAGQLQQCAAPLEIYNSPANQFVASFVGNPTMNFLSGHVELANSVIRLIDVEGAAIPLPPRLPLGAIQDGMALLVGFRPEHITILRQGDETGPFDIPGKIWTIEPMGVESFVTVNLGFIRLKVRCEAQFSEEMGEPCWLRCNWVYMHLFEEGGDGARLI